MGAFVHGFAVTDNKFSGGAFDWLTPFSALTAAALLSGYVLLSAGWLIMKGDEALREWAYGIAFSALVGGRDLHRHFQRLDAVPAPGDRRALVQAGQYGDAEPGAARHRGVRRGAVASAKAHASAICPSCSASGIFMLCYTGLAVSLFPFIIPPDITIWQAAAAPDSQLFMLYGAVPLLPIILGYTAYSYYVFWEASEHDAYH